MPEKNLFISFYCRGLNPTEAEVQDIMNQYDSDGNGEVRWEQLKRFYTAVLQIEWHEFANLLASKLDLEDENYFKETFRVFSKNDEGKGKSNMQTKILLLHKDVYQQKK